MNSSRFLSSLPVILSAISAFLSFVEVYTFDVTGYLAARLETWLLLVFVSLYVYLASKYVLGHVNKRRKFVFGVLSGGGAHLIGSTGGGVLWLVVDRLSSRTAFGGLAVAFSDWSGEYSINLIGILVALLCTVIYLTWVPFLQLGAVVVTALLGCYMAGYFEFNRLPERLVDKVVFVSHRLREVRIGLPVFSGKEQEMLTQYWTEEGLKVFSEMRSAAVAPALKQAFYWCIRDRIDCRFVENTIAGNSVEFPRSSLEIGTCDDLQDLSSSQLLSHRGITSVSIGGKGRPCMVLSTWTEMENLFPDLRELGVYEPGEDFLRALPDHVTSLSVRMGEVSAGVLEAIGRHRQIVSLKLSTRSLPESALFYLSNMESLRTLWAKGTGFPAIDLKARSCLHCASLLWDPVLR